MRRITSAILFALASQATAQNTAQTITLEPLSTYRAGPIGSGAAEIVRYDAPSRCAVLTNADRNAIDILSLADPARPSLVLSIALDAFGGGINSVDIANGLIAAAVEGFNKQDPGRVVLFRLDGSFVALVEAGALPDMLTFTKGGTRIVVANEGEPSQDYANDPEGSITIIDLPEDPRRLGQRHARTATFTRFNSEGIHPDVRTFGPGASIAQDLEPEYITTSHDGTTAWVTLQENNALAIVDLEAGVVTDVVPLGFKDHRTHGLDTSDRDNAISIAAAPVFGMPQPDTIASIVINDQTYLVTADEGDPRRYDAFDETVRVKDLTLDPAAFPDADYLQRPEVMGRLRVSRVMGDDNRDGMHEALYAFGGRGFTIRDAQGHPVFESGPQLEWLSALRAPEHFNADNAPGSDPDNRSIDRGPEPEALALGHIEGRAYAFIGLERTSAIAVYDITDPSAARPVAWATRRPSGTATSADPGDLGPEGMTFVPAADSPTGTPLLIVANEVSATVTTWQISTTGTRTNPSAIVGSDRPTLKNHP